MNTTLADILRQTKWLDETQYQTLMASPQNTLEVLMEFTDQNSAELAKHLSQYFHLPLIHLEDFDYVSMCQKFPLPTLWQHFQAIPIQSDQRLTVAVADPSNSELEQELRFHTGLEIDIVITDGKALLAALYRLFQPQIAESATKYTTSGTEKHHDINAINDTNDESISQYIEQILYQAATQKASDIHFEPNENHYRIRFRIDGLLRTVTQAPAELSARLAGRLKILANLDIAERRLPQDGRTQLQLTQRNDLDIRVSTLPTIWGEKIVLRLLNQNTHALQIDQLGMSAQQQSVFIHALKQPQGLILITGPTGSGKTVSLYSALNHINRDTMNIATAEDPVEILLDGVNQVEVKPQIGFDFSHALRAFLRQDPDVIMIGEIRDKETADIAVKAAQTGHLVLATLHTNSAAQSISRLMQIGIAPYNVSASLNLIVSQRLIRKLCPQCKILVPPISKLVEKRQSTTPITCYNANPNGCAHCHQGYKGRIGIYEVIHLDASLIHAINQQATSEQLDSLARQAGSESLYQSGLEKWAQGLTSHAELERVLLSE